MPIVETQSLQQNQRHPQQLQVYNGLDCCVTLEVHEHLEGLLAKAEFPEPKDIYAFERALQAPALDMMLRGFKIDESERQKGIKSLQETIVKYGGRLGPKERFAPESALQQMAQAVWGKPLNPLGTQQLKDFFYEHMRLPPVYKSKKGQRLVSMDRDALEHLSLYHFARPLVNYILAIKDLAKQLSVLQTEVDFDGRMRTSYNIAGTETGRWSSSGNAFGTGTNLQNITGKLRKIFVADPGWKLCGIDLEQAESREVGLLCGSLFQDWGYLDACESGDLHTLTCKLIWPGLGWTGDPAGDRQLAERLFYRDFSYRDMSKRGGHGSNYMGTPFTMAHHLKVPKPLMEDFQRAYFQAFPAIPRWHQWTATQIQTTQKLTTGFGRTRHFFGRSNDDTTLREAIAYIPQSSTGDRLNLALWRVWKHMPQVQLLAQVHDAFYFQFPEHLDENEIIGQALELVNITTSHNGRRFTVPGEAKVGWNWGNHDDRPGAKFNPMGLKKWKPGVADSRKRLEGLDSLM